MVARSAANETVLDDFLSLLNWGGSGSAGGEVMQLAPAARLERRRVGDKLEIRVTQCTLRDDDGGVYCAKPYRRYQYS